MSTLFFETQSQVYYCKFGGHIKNILEDLSVRGPLTAGLGLPLIPLFFKGDVFFDPEHIYQPETLKEAVNTRYNQYEFRPVILLNVARYLPTSLRGPAQPYTDERASASCADG